MDLDHYQLQASATDQVPGTGTVASSGPDVLVPLLGLAGETGEILSEYKKYLRDGPAHKLFAERLREELGDLLWYLSNAATKFGLTLNDIADTNLTKCRARWEYVARNQMETPLPRQAFDAAFPSEERLPRQAVAELSTERLAGVERATMTFNGKPFGDPLTDNRYAGDGYRFHDVFHLAYAAVLGWSPLTRKLSDHKRKSDARIDEVEDGGRAIVIEEGIAAMVFSYAEQHNFLDGLERVDYELLRTIKTMTSHLEVRRCSVGEWEDAIVQGFDVWREISGAGGGKVALDLDQAKILFVTGVP